MPLYNFHFSRNGFSLIEVMVVIALIGIVIGVSVPNLRQFSATQEIDAAASQLINVLRTAQSSAASHIKCPDGGVSNNWSVVLKSIDYALNSNCSLSGDDYDKETYSSLYASTENASTAFNMTNDKCTAGQELKFTFTGQQLTYECGGVLVNSWPVRITLKNTGETLSKVIVVEEGGVIRTE